MTRVDIEMLDPGIRRTVEWLGSEGFETTDSGDGRTKPANGDAEALAYPHVYMTTHPRHLAVSAGYLRDRLRETGVSVGEITVDCSSPCIHASFDPCTMVGVIALMGVDDAVLFGSGTRCGSAAWTGGLE